MNLTFVLFSSMATAVCEPKMKRTSKDKHLQTHLKIPPLLQAANELCRLFALNDTGG